MPYSPAQCRKFAVMASRGEKPPQDWKAHCRKGKTVKKRRTRKKS